MQLSKRTGLILLLIVLALGLASCQAIASGDSVVISQGEYAELRALEDRFSKLLELEAQIKHNYYEDTSEVDFDTAILKGLFSALNDPYSTYFTPPEYAEFNQELSGEYVGIGTYINQREDGLIEVVAPIKGSPADAAGIMPGDIIWKVDETEVQTLELTQASDMMRGEEGTPVKVFIRRDNENLEFELIRAKILVPSIESEVREGGVGYIKINSFEANTSADFMSALADLEAQNIESLIIDLRNNGGGYLSSVVEIADRILGKTVIVTTVAPSGAPTDYSSDEMTRIDLPLVVLVNRGSASASEILAGAVQDTQSGVIIGETTFGKGIVQSTFDLKDGSGFRLTTSYYLTPNGNNIHKLGITPDITHEDLAEAGYEIDEMYRIGEEGDRILDYAIDYLRDQLQ
ncbi:MAG TPA: S41 family peptidase [Tissierellia bacterium]|nr:S41 family peptidase [Tissierellia bacterium]